MRIPLDEKLIVRLGTDLMHKLEKDNIQPSDCKILSRAINKKTGSNISETTLKRLYGFAKRNFNFSFYTLDTFANFLDYKSWEAYFSSLQYHNNQEEEQNWSDLRGQALKYSLFGLRATQNATGIPFSKTVQRTGFFNYIDRFMQSSQRIAPIIAPSGFGKSVSLAQTILKFWMGENSLYKEDICYYITTHQLYTLTTNKSSLMEWINQLLEVDEKMSILKMKDKPEQHFVLIIDGFDERTLSSDKLKLIAAGIMEFINLHVEYDWIKVILSLRPSVWEKKVKPFISIGAYHNHFFIDESQPDAHHLNHTLPFSHQETKEFLLQYNIPESITSNFSEPFLNFISFPRYQELLSRVLPQLTHTIFDEEYLFFKINEINLKNLFSQKLNTLLNSSSIQHLLNYMGEEGCYSNKDDLLGKNSEHLDLYNEMIDQYLLREEKNSRYSLYPSSRVCFTNKLLRGYFSAWILIEKNNSSISPELIDELYHEQKYYFILPFLKWYLSDIFYQNAHGSIQEIFHAVSLTPHDKFELYVFLLRQYGNSMEGRTLLKQLDEQHRLLDYFLESGIFLCYLHPSYEDVFIAMLSLCRDINQTASVIISLFMGSLLRMNLPESEMWLNEFRLCVKKDNKAHFAMSETLMVTSLDLARFRIHNETLAATINDLMHKSSKLLEQPIYFSYIIALHASHILLFNKMYDTLCDFTGKVVPKILKYDKNYHTVHMLLNAIQTYTSLRDGKELPETLLLKLKEQKDSDDPYISFFNQMIQISKCMQSNELVAAARHCYIAYDIALKSQFNLYKYLARQALKEVQAASSNALLKVG